MYSVFNPRGEKIADCGFLMDAINLVNMRNNRWEGHYYQYKPTYETVDIKPFPQNQLPTNDIVVNMDGGVGGSWTIRSPQLNENEQQPFDLK